MVELPLARPSAVAVIRTPANFLVEGRPAQDGLSYPGMLQLFGGHIEFGENPEEPVETPERAICRELYEELGLVLPEAPRLIRVGITESRNRLGEPVRRRVSLFHVALQNEIGLEMKIPGELVRIPRSVQSIRVNKDHLTLFAYRSLLDSIILMPGD